MTPEAEALAEQITASSVWEQVQALASLMGIEALDIISQDPNIRIETVRRMQGVFQAWRRLELLPNELKAIKETRRKNEAARSIPDEPRRVSPRFPEPGAGSRDNG